MKITARSLKEQRINKTESYLKQIETMILEFESQGKRFVQFNVPAQAEADAIMTELIKHGFKVSRSKGSDLRGNGWDYLHIAWD